MSIFQRLALSDLVRGVERINERDIFDSKLAFPMNIKKAKNISLCRD